MAPNSEPNLNPSPAPTPVQPAAPTMPTPGAAASAPASPAPKKILTPEEKAAKIKMMIKRIVTLAAGAYVLVLAFATFWAFTLAGKNFSFFKFLGTKQANFDSFLMTLVNLELGLLVFVTVFISLFFLFKNISAKKEDLEKKKAAAKKAMIFSGVFVFSTILWIIALLFLNPRLNPNVFVGIATNPENTLGLTAPVEIEFDATSIPVDQDVYRILAYSWNFGDGATANGPVVSHRFTKKAPGDGIYRVELLVKYQDLSSSQQFDQTLVVQVGILNEKTSAIFVASPTSGEIPLKVRFDASSSFDPDGEIVSYEWDLDGDGQFDDANAKTANYTYEQEGSYEVSLRVTDNNGDTNIATTLIEAGTVNGLRAIITSDLAGGEFYYTDEKYTFSGELSQIQSGNINKYTWNFGDGTKNVQSRSTSHTFANPGTYSVELTIYDQEGNTDSTTNEITVVDQGTPPTAKIKSEPVVSGDTITGPVPLEVIFDGGTSTDKEDDIIEYEWDFDNDGQIDDTGESVNHIYEKEGMYEARLVVTDAAGNQGEKVVNIEVAAQGIIARITSDITNGEVPLTVNFDASSSTYKGEEIASYSYDFGDGSKTYTGGSSVSYKYTSVGTFTVTLTITGTDGKTDTATTVVVIRPVEITACFEVNTDSGTAPVSVSVDPSCSKGAISSYKWSFGDGDISYDRKPANHIYDKKGTYTITLEVTGDSGVVDMFTKDIEVK